METRMEIFPALKERKKERIYKIYNSQIQNTKFMRIRLASMTKAVTKQMNYWNPFKEFTVSIVDQS